jgi:hypothetical protein
MLPYLKVVNNCRKSQDLLGLLGVSQPDPGPEGLVSYPSLDNPG